MSKMNSLLLLISFYYVLSNYFVNSIIVTTNLGQIRGKDVYIEDQNKTIGLFRGIPFAKPPTGALRFKPAVPVDKWAGVWDATQPRSSCMQPEDDNISEDCLFLNIYVPHNRFNANNITNMKKSVMLWIYGGSFITGSIFSDQFNATYLSAVGDVVVVEVNYRLSAFGFLYDGSDESAGNQAFTDLLMALQFVHKNIEFFGGDPDSVTIFGESAGSMSVSALVLMKNQNLFNRAIMQSGSVDSYLGSESKETALFKAQQLAKQFNCFNNITNKINITCLRNADPKQIVTICNKMKFNDQFFTPIFGDKLLPIKPSIALETGQYNQNISLLFGTCNDEGSGFVSNLGFSDLSAKSPNNSMNLSKAKLIIQIVFEVMKMPFGKEVAEFYTKDLTDEDGVELKHAVANAFGDFHLTCPTIKFGSKLSITGKAYAYRLTFSTRDNWTGVQHGDDIKYVFANPLRYPQEYSQLERQLTFTFVHTWSTFAKTGKPPKVDDIEWPEAIDKKSSNPSVKYLTLNPEDYRIVENEYRKSCDSFWKLHIN